MSKGDLCRSLIHLPGTLLQRHGTLLSARHRVHGTAGAGTYVPGYEKVPRPDRPLGCNRCIHQMHATTFVICPPSRTRLHWTHIDDCFRGLREPATRRLPHLLPTCCYLGCHSFIDPVLSALPLPLAHDATGRYPCAFPIYKWRNTGGSGILTSSHPHIPSQSLLRDPNQPRGSSLLCALCSLLLAFHPYRAYAAG